MTKSVTWLLIAYAFVRAKAKTVDAACGFDLLSELLNFLLFFFEQPSDCVECFAQILLVLR